MYAVAWYFDMNIKWNLTLRSIERVLKNGLKMEQKTMISCACHTWIGIGRKKYKAADRDAWRRMFKPKS